MKNWRCPGVHRGIETQPCPRCGEDVEYFPSDREIACSGCGELVLRISSSCLSHCPAKQSSCYRQMVRQEALTATDTGGDSEQQT
ncbi:MAG TPA: hypothetical protein ENH54_02805 [Actinobacteria bacterium]|nr:hypothetical protein [Actinomycetota bacterium]